MTRIAVVGMACRYPDASCPDDLWDNALAGRRAFRRLPDERMRLADYYSPDPAAPDRFYARHAAVLAGYEFDRVAFRIAGSTFRATDLTHWLALEVSAAALADAGFSGGERLNRARTGVVMGNTLTGEFSRANQLRVRWPYVRRTVGAALRDDGWQPDRLATFLDELEHRFKQPFPAVDEDTLAGGLSNTIAGRICNYFDFRGGGYTVDGACSSSLLSVINACQALEQGDLDAAVAGGVDLSIDPFEIIGFAKTGALAREEMRVYDRGSNGFWPGEGCGMVVLMREADALAAGQRIYATLSGWGVSSDGKGGITRPTASGYQLALDRAYQRAGVGVSTVSLFEGHGTGTSVGDATELRALSQARRAADPSAPPAAIGSVKAMIGHTKAAAGVASLVKSAMALHHGTLPPTIGCRDPHPELSGQPPALRTLPAAEPWPAGAPLRAGVTAMGFGGINTHVVLEAPESSTATRATAEPALTSVRPAGSTRSARIALSIQDAELLLVDGENEAELQSRLHRTAALAARLSYGQLADLSEMLRAELADRPFRAAAVVRSPDQAEQRLTRLADLARDVEQTPPVVDVAGGVFLGVARSPARVGLLFPGQGSGRGLRGGALRRRFPPVARVYEHAGLPDDADTVATAVAQPRIVAGSLAGLAALRLLALTGTVAVGHSLGELAALHWAGAMGSSELIALAHARGEAMATHARSGTMASITAPPEAIAELLAGEPSGEDAVVIAGYNGPSQTVVAGPELAVRRLGEAATATGWAWTLLPVSHAFHSPLMGPAAEAFEERLSSQQFHRLTGTVVSTVTGSPLPPAADLGALLRRQITSPVRFAAALAQAAAEVDLFVEVGPGSVLTGLAGRITSVPAVSVDVDDESLTSLLSVVGAGFVVGARMALDPLWQGRLLRPLGWDYEPYFLASPCEQAPAHADDDAVPDGDGLADGDPAAGGDVVAGVHASASGEPGRQAEVAGDGSSIDLLERLRALSAERAELPVESVTGDSRLLDDLHLSSISVGQLLNQAATERGLPPVQASVNVATATLRELAAALEIKGGTADGTGDGGNRHPSAAGIASWVRPFRVNLVAAPPPVPAASQPNGAWQAFHRDDHPFGERLRRELESAGVGSGVLVCLPPRCGAEDLRFALAGARVAVSGSVERLVMVHHGRGGSGLAKTAHLEAPGLRTTIVDLPEGDSDPVRRVRAEVAGTDGFTEVCYGPDGIRRRPVLRPQPFPPPVTANATATATATDGATATAATAAEAGDGDGSVSMPVGPADVMLVTGGGKGITAECALALAVPSGARLAVLGRSDPTVDQELARNLERMRASGVTVRYAAADVTDPVAVADAVRRLQAALGPVTAVLHGAGWNQPAPLSRLEESDLRRALAPKVDGLRAVLAAIDPARLRLLVAFGSIIGRAGLAGEGHYATANDWLADLVAEFAEEHPGCRTLCLEWSVWSGVGMGERLSVVESLLDDGVHPISPDQGIEVMRRLLADPSTGSTVVVAGRVGRLSTLQFDEPELALGRFLDRPLVHYPGVELITEAELSQVNDPYLDDHVFEDNALWPAVLGLEAMAQVAGAVAGTDGLSTFEDIQFSRPVVVPPAGSTTVQIAALVTGPDRVEVAVRSSETGFGIDHFRATARLAGDKAPAKPGTAPAKPGTAPALPGPLVTQLRTPDAVPLVPARDLYGDILFQGKRFQRLLRYLRVTARYAEAEVATGNGSWFGAYLPGGLSLGDPGARDALMHGVQVCVPDAILLPEGVTRLWPGARSTGTGQVRFEAIERSHQAETYVYDIVVRDETGAEVERWDGLRLRAVRTGAGPADWPVPLLGPLLQRRFDAVFGAGPGGSVDMLVEPDVAGARRDNTAHALARLLGRPSGAATGRKGGPELRYRPDGRPEVAGYTVSASHTSGMTMVVAAAGELVLGCDAEQVVAVPPTQWERLLGRHAPLAQVLVTESDEEFDVAATRVWCAIESLQKSGLGVAGPLTVADAPSPGVTVFLAGQAEIATACLPVRGVEQPVVFAVLVARGRLDSRRKEIE